MAMISPAAIGEVRFTARAGADPTPEPIDAVTALPIGRLLRDHLTEAIARERRQDWHLALCSLDLNGFTRTRERLGDAAADAILQSVAARLTGALRQSDVVSRTGRDRFAVVLSDIRHPGDATLVARKLLQAIAAPGLLDAAPDLYITASIGIALCPDHGRDASTLIANANLAMDDAKRAGHGNCRLFHSQLDLSRQTGAWSAAGLRSILAGVEVTAGCGPDSVANVPMVSAD